MNKTLTALAALALGSGLVAGSVTTADAASGKHTVKTDVHMSSKYTFDMDKNTVTVHGNVKSDGCKKHRTVKVRQTDDDVYLGKTKTNGKGDWSLTFKGDEANPGTFKATAPKVVRGKLTCKSGSDKASIGENQPM